MLSTFNIEAIPEELFSDLEAAPEALFTTALPEELFLETLQKELPAFDLEALPEEILIKILNHFLPEEFLSFSANKSWHKLKQNNQYWQDKFKKHFSYRLNEIKSESDWYNEFYQIYWDQYPYLSQSERKIFSQVNENHNNIKLSFDQLQMLQDRSGHFLYYLAYRKKNQTLLNYFYSLCADYFSVNDKTEQERGELNSSLLYWAFVCNQSPDVIEKLRKYANIDYGLNLLLLPRVAYCGNLSLVKKLLEWGANDWPGVLGYDPPIYFATLMGYHEIVEVLIKAGANPEYTSEGEKDRLLITAIKRGHSEVVRVLLKNNACLWDDADKKPAYHLALKRGDLNTLNVLLEFADDSINQKNAKGEAILATSAKWGNIFLVKELLRHPRIDIHTHTEKGKFPIHFATGRGHIEIVRIFLNDHKMNVNINDGDGKTLLHKATRYHQNDMVSELLTHPEINVNASTWRQKMTPLHVAVAKKNLTAVKQLLEHPDIKLDLRTREANQTALDIAKQERYTEIIEAIENKQKMRDSNEQKSKINKNKFFPTPAEENIEPPNKKIKYGNGCSWDSA